MKIQVMVRILSIIISETNQLFLLGTIQMQVLTLFLMEFSKFNWGFEVLLNCFSGWAINACKKKQTKSGYLTINYLNVHLIATSRDFPKAVRKVWKAGYPSLKTGGVCVGGLDATLSCNEMSTFWQKAVKIGLNRVHVFPQVSGNSLNLSLIHVLQLC